jgi:protoporphyrinogen oxidase
MEQVEYLVVGAGVTGLSFANWIRQEHAARGLTAPLTAIVEAEQEPGGFCRTVVRDGFVWDYSGHFFHFRYPEIEAFLRARMSGEVRTVTKRAVIRFAGDDIDFPFQKNIHQLPREDFIDCLVSLYFRDQGFDTSQPPASFREMLYRRFGSGIADRFLVPYNEKLYACDLDSLDVDAMGRFFPHADIADIIRNMRAPPGTGDAGYNATFTYPARGAMEYVRALLHDLPKDCLSLGERLEAVDLSSRVARTDRRQLSYRYLVSSAPLPRLLAMCSLQHHAAAFGWNQVLVFNLGFDGKGPSGVHWIYFPDRRRRFYRVGFYDNILDGERMSLYVEIGARRGERLEVAAERERVLADLASESIVRGQKLTAWHSVLLDPAYVHITRAGQAEVSRCLAALEQYGVFSVGRYGRWTYCSIEDNLVETRALARKLATPLRG